MKQLRLSQDEYDAFLARRLKSTATREEAYAARTEKKLNARSKYNNEIIEVNGERFDSKAEYRYYTFLIARLNKKEITDLKRQVQFILAPAVEIGGRKRPPLRYIADMTWIENGKLNVADVKGAVTDSYRIKRHLMKSVHDIDILEIRSS